MKLIWIRHGETDSNRERKYLGHSDIPLNEKGEQQARELARQLSQQLKRPVALYASDLLRCTQTARPLADEWGLPIISVPALRELSFGDWELLTYEELMRSDAEWAARWYDDPYRCSPPNGESLQELGHRVDGWLRKLLEQRQAAADETTVCVAHGGVIRWFQAVWLENDPKRYWHVDGVGHGEALLAQWDGRRWRRLRLEGLKRGTT
ncbi:phosphoglycerate mutase [Brevibacillus agri]|uniref:Histidine phosphatase family protein n=1 Tax=Brevibacillus agri TaxID=51101 RepID=A0A3M8AW45_9BACL|nr:histidine phosphatase family protein [Brevibacillus agri]MBG9567148.1 alpha-ribazole phosphatase [Brevibacillus agri]MCG5254088.1 histidine phosphatase family protein [Brevibacillus agri]MDR9505786.1 histidine phosphatase family protein [Brevibacillus agri]QAV15325.1 histidine phosphatase family protein [Brevibacillus agri]RNB55426.1 histidine phosphatase family protein [Brevibacillus agri]